MIRPWTRQDFIKAMEDEQLRKKVCATLSSSDPSKARAEDVVDSKFFFWNQCPLVLQLFHRGHKG
jgi:hypothetical protein